MSGCRLRPADRRGCGRWEQHGAGPDPKDQPMNLAKNARRMARPPFVADSEIAPNEIGTTAGTDAMVEGLQKRPTKQSLVIAILRKPEGASLADLVAATSWQAHTIRAALTGLRKKNHAIER